MKHESMVLDTIPGLNKVIDSRLAFITILRIKRSGIGQNKVSTTPANREAYHNSNAGSLAFDSSNRFNEGETVYVLIKH